MFGDLKMQVFDPSGTKLTEFTPQSKHKGLNRASVVDAAASADYSPGSAGAVPGIAGTAGAAGNVSGEAA